MGQLPRMTRGAFSSGSTRWLQIQGEPMAVRTPVGVTVPESNASDVVLNWQRGLSVSHHLLMGTAAGQWTINGVRAHEIEADHTGSFVPVNATITVSP